MKGSPTSSVSAKKLGSAAAPTARSVIWLEVTPTVKDCMFSTSPITPKSAEKAELSAKISGIVVVACFSSKKANGSIKVKMAITVLLTSFKLKGIFTEPKHERHKNRKKKKIGYHKPENKRLIKKPGS
jgi:hypothetical protein